jgi:hypothetical protein
MDHARARAWGRDILMLERGAGQEDVFAVLWMDRGMNAGAYSGLTVRRCHC